MRLRKTDTYLIETKPLMVNGVSGNRYVYFIDAEYEAGHSFGYQKLLFIYDEPGHCGDKDPVDYGYGKITLIDITNTSDGIDEKIKNKELRIEDYLYKFPTDAYPLDDVAEYGKDGNGQYVVLSLLLPMNSIIYESLKGADTVIAREIADYLAVNIKIYYNPDYGKPNTPELYPGYIFFTKHMVIN